MPKKGELSSVGEKRRNKTRGEIKDLVSRVKVIYQSKSSHMGFIRYRGGLFKGMGTSSDAVRKSLELQIWEVVAHGRMEA